MSTPDGNPRADRDTSAISRRSFLELSGSTALLAGGDLLTRVGRAYPQETGKKIRIGVVGGGFGAGFWWHEHPNCVVTGVTDLFPGRRQVLRNRYRCDDVYDSLEIMIKEAKDINALVEDREPVIDLYESLAMTVPGIVAHQSAFKDGEQLPVPQFERSKA